jgi:hypothetical protein
MKEPCDHLSTADARKGEVDDHGITTRWYWRAEEGLGVGMSDDILAGRADIVKQGIPDASVAFDNDHGHWVKVPLTGGSGDDGAMAAAAH